MKIVNKGIGFSAKLVIGIVFFYLFFGEGDFIENIIITFSSFTELNVYSYMVYIVAIGLFLIILGFYYLFFVKKESKTGNVFISLAPLGLILIMTQILFLIDDVLLQTLSRDPNNIILSFNCFMIILGIFGSYISYNRKVVTH